MTLLVTITRKFGNTNRIVGQILDENDEPVNISSWTQFAMTVDSRAAPVGNSTAVATTVGGLVSTGLDGMFYILISGTIPVGKYFYDVQARDSNNEKITFMEGGYVVTQTRTKL